VLLASWSRAAAVLASSGRKATAVEKALDRWSSCRSTRGLRTGFGRDEMRPSLVTGVTRGYLVMEGTQSAVFQVIFSRSCLKGGSKARRALAFVERGGVIKANNRTVARENRSSFPRASFCDKGCPGTNRLG
jgi:hypothetical protein